MALPVRMSRVSSLLLLLAIAFAGLALPARASAGNRGRTLVALEPRATCEAAATLAGAGATLFDGDLGLWSIASDDASRVITALRAGGALRYAEPVRTYATAAVGAQPADPLSAGEWWRAQIGVESVTPPGPGVPVTIVDSGVGFEHPEFAGRPNTIALNAQDPAPLGGRHGTSVASVIGAPANGLGIVGIYPEAVLRSWDTAPGLQNLDTTEIVNGILAAARAGKGVINLSLGGSEPDSVIEDAVGEAVSRGSLIVAAAGNDGERGNPLEYPASLPHVLTVGATDRSGGVAGFSSTSVYIDLVAPGVEIPVAEVQSNGWQTSQGTSFAAPLVSGAAAWVWTVRPELDALQVAEVLRRSARDLGAPGRDRLSGFGILNVAGALAHPTPVRDKTEPNDDIDTVDPNRERFYGQQTAITTKSRQRTTFTATLDAYEDPRDVYRVWLPARSTVTMTVGSSTDNDLVLFREGIPTIGGRLIADYRIARAQARGRTERLTYANPGAGRFAYLAVTVPRGVVDATYRLTVGSRPTPRAH
ncbi:MAG: S8 family serine peptidase [Gaiella sp.]